MPRTTIITSETTDAGTRLRVHLHDGAVLDGILDRADARTLRLRPTGGGRLVLIYRVAATAIEAA